MVLPVHALAVVLLAAPPKAEEIAQVEKRFENTHELTYASGKVFQAGDVVIVKDLVLALSIKFVRLGFPRVSTPAGTRQAKEELAVVGYTVSNRAPTRKAQYTRPNRFLASANNGLSDEHGNAYKWIEFGPGVDLVGRQATNNLSIYPGQSLLDLVAFEAPVSAAKTLRFTLPLSIFAAGDNRRVMFQLDVDGLLSTLHQRRAEFLAAIDTGIPALKWRMSQDAVKNVLPRIKHDDPPRWAAGAPIDCWYDIQAVMAGTTANTELCFYRNQLHEVRLNFEKLSLDEWVKTVSTTPLGTPTSTRQGRATWEFGPTRLFAFESFGHLLVNAEYIPLKMEEPPHE